MLTVNDCLIIVHDKFYIGETLEGTVAIPEYSFDIDDAPKLLKDEIWELKKTWAFRWYDSGIGYMTDNEWSADYSTAQYAFNDAYNIYGDIDYDDDDLEWKRFADENGLRFE